MKCTLCGHEFDEQKASGTCKRCVVSRGCDLVKCPNCGMDVPRTPKWIEKLKLLITRFTRYASRFTQRTE